MTTRFDAIVRSAAALTASLVLAAVIVSAAVPVVPIA